MSERARDWAIVVLLGILASGCGKSEEPAPTPKAQAAVEPAVVPTPESVPAVPAPKPAPIVTSAAAWKSDLADAVPALPPGAIARIGTRRFNHTAWLLASEMSPDGTLIALGGMKGVVQMWSYPEGELLREFSFEDSVVDFAFSPDGTRLAIVHWPGLVVIHDASNPDARVELHEYDRVVPALAFYDGVPASPCPT